MHLFKQNKAWTTARLMQLARLKLKIGRRRFSFFFRPASSQGVKQRRRGLTTQAVFPSSMARVFSAARAKPSAVSASSRLLLAWWTFSSCSLSPQTDNTATGHKVWTGSLQTLEVKDQHAECRRRAKYFLILNFSKSHVGLRSYMGSFKSGFKKIYI